MPAVSEDSSTEQPEEAATDRDQHQQSSTEQPEGASTDREQQACSSGLPVRSLCLLIAAYATGLAAIGITLAATAVAAKDVLQEQGQHTSLATIPTGLQMLGSMCSTYPISLLMKRKGRAAGFAASSCLGVLGGALCAIAVQDRSIALLSLGSLLVGGAATGTQLIRFAALDVVPDDWSARAASFVVAGGLVGAICGPFAAAAAKNSIGSHEFIGTYVVLTATSLLQGFILVSVPYPKRTETIKGAGEQQQPAGLSCWGVLKGRRDEAMLLSATCYAIMVTVMTPTPIVMQEDGYSFSESSTVIQLHLAAMFAPSFFTGDVIKATSSHLVAYCGTALLMCSFVVCMLGRQMVNFAVGLVLLGLGWNGGFVGATVMLADRSPPHEAERLQGINDTGVFALSATGVLLSAVIVESEIGWIGLLWIAMACTATALCVVVVLRILKVLAAKGSEAPPAACVDSEAVLAGATPKSESAIDHKAGRSEADAFVVNPLPTLPAASPASSVGTNIPHIRAHLDKRL